VEENNQEFERREKTKLTLFGEVWENTDIVLLTEKKEKSIRR